MTRRVELALSGQEPSILAVDFPASLDDGGDVVGMLSQTGTKAAVYQLDPVGDLAEDGAASGLDDVISSYATALRDARVRPSLLVGYCMASMLTLGLASQLNASGSKIDGVVLLNPQRPGRQTLDNAYNEALVSLDSQSDAPPAWDDGSEDVMREVERAFEEGAKTLRDDPDFGDEMAPMVAELTARYRSWVGFLLGSKRFPAPSLTCPVYHLNARTNDQSSPLHTGTTVVEHRFDVDDLAILGHTPAQETLAAIGGCS